ncbi:scavenger receptor class F member 1-like [Haliotis cracherodii]|uniref:scavenger receptor class F member 1-like n=1 Tax=Haliotis cracherodii TaxID=6455 RepID=UPI0039EC237F
MKEVITSSLPSFTVTRHSQTLHTEIPGKWSSANSDMAPMTILCVVCIMVYTRAAKCKGYQHCSECDSTTGHCISECEPGYFDQKCSYICNKKCRNKQCKLLINGNDNCTEVCVPGYQVLGCSRPCYNPGGVCTVCPGGCDGEYCQLSSSCVSGCVDFYYGSGCKTCHRGCKACNRITETCTECHPSFPGPNCEQETNTNRGCEGGCVPGHIDRDCKHCSDKCLNKTSRPKNEPFDKRCNPGFYGENCNKTCGVCIEGDCDQMTGMCFRGCNRTTHGCEPSCRVKCTLAECTTCPQDGNDDQKTGSVLTWLLASLLLPVSGILLTLCLCYCKRFPKQREQEEHQDQMQQDEVEYLQYLPTVQGDTLNTNRHSNHAYYDVIDGEKGPAIVFL